MCKICLWRPWLYSECMCWQGHAPLVRFVARGGYPIRNPLLALCGRSIVPIGLNGRAPALGFMREHVPLAVSVAIATRCLVRRSVALGLGGYGIDTRGALARLLALPRWRDGEGIETKSNERPSDRSRASAQSLGARFAEAEGRGGGEPGIEPGECRCRSLAPSRSYRGNSGQMGWGRSTSHLSAASVATRWRSSTKGQRPIGRLRSVGRRSTRSFSTGGRAAGEERSSRRTGMGRCRRRLSAVREVAIVEWKDGGAKVHTSQGGARSFGKSVTKDTKASAHRSRDWRHAWRWAKVGGELPDRSSHV